MVGDAQKGPTQWGAVAEGDDSEIAYLVGEIISASLAESGFDDPGKLGGGFAENGRGYHSARLRGERNGLLSRSTESKRQPREHHKVGVQADPRQSTNAERRESVVMLERSEFAFDCGAATVEGTEFRRVPLNAGVESRRTFNDRQHDLGGPLALDRDDREDSALRALGVNAVGVIALVEGSRPGLEAASVELVEQRRD